MVANRRPTESADAALIGGLFDLIQATIKIKRAIPPSTPAKPLGQSSVAEGASAKNFATAMISQVPSDAMDDSKALNHGKSGELRQARMPKTVIGATNGSAKRFAGIE
jgi:hypothetical protein